MSVATSISPVIQLTEVVAAGIAVWKPGRIEEPVSPASGMTGNVHGFPARDHAAPALALVLDKATSLAQTMTNPGLVPATR